MAAHTEAVVATLFCMQVALRVWIPPPHWQQKKRKRKGKGRVSEPIMKRVADRRVCVRE